MAHRKAGGTAKNVRDSQGQRLGVKLFGGQAVKPGEIIIRQRGTKWHPGDNVKQGKDDTLYAMKAGVIKFTRRKRAKFHGNLAWESVVNVIDQN